MRVVKRGGRGQDRGEMSMQELLSPNSSTARYEGVGT
jgi:hypothetical protein